MDERSGKAPGLVGPGAEAAPCRKDGPWKETRRVAFHDRSPLCSATFVPGMGGKLPGAQTPTPQRPPGALVPCSRRTGTGTSHGSRGETRDQSKAEIYEGSSPPFLFPRWLVHQRLSIRLRDTDSRGNGSKHQNKRARPYRAFLLCVRRGNPPGFPLTSIPFRQRGRSRQAKLAFAAFSKCPV
jgi:hypothetical protein